MGHTRGPLLKALAERVLSNLDHIERHASSLDPSANVPPYADTQLLISLLGVIVFPHERSSKALGSCWRSIRNSTASSPSSIRRVCLRAED